MKTLTDNVCNYYNWNKKIVLFIDETERFLDENSNITKTDLENLIGRIKNTANYISKMEKEYIPNLTQSLQLLAMNGHFTQDDEDILSIYLDNPSESPETRETLLTKWANHRVINIPEMRQKLGKIMIALENKPVRTETICERFCVIS